MLFLNGFTSSNALSLKQKQTTVLYQINIHNNTVDLKKYTFSKILNNNAMKLVTLREHRKKIFNNLNQSLPYILK